MSVSSFNSVSIAYPVVVLVKNLSPETPVGPVIPVHPVLPVCPVGPIIPFKLMKYVLFPFKLAPSAIVTELIINIAYESYDAYESTVP
jgi:hypothetical protein